MQLFENKIIREYNLYKHYYETISVYIFYKYIKNNELQKKNIIQI